MTHDRRTCSMGWPNPRSVANENAPTISASVTPESPVPVGIAGSLRARLGGVPLSHLWGEPRTTLSRALRTVESELHGRGGQDVNHARAEHRTRSEMVGWGCVPRGTRRPRLRAPGHGTRII